MDGDEDRVRGSATIGDADVDDADAGPPEKLPRSAISPPDTPAAWPTPLYPPLTAACGLPSIEEGELTNEGGGGLCVIHPAAPRRKQMDQDLKGIG